MTSRFGRLLLMLFVTVFGGVAVAQAQIASDTRIQADIPFNFTVGDATLSAGKYEVRRIEDLAQNILEIRSVDGRASVIFDATPAQTKDTRPSDQSELVFDKYGDRYFLSQIWVEGTSTGNELLKSRMEKKVAIAFNEPGKQSVAAVVK